MKLFLTFIVLFTLCLHAEVFERSYHLVDLMGLMSVDTYADNPYARLDLDATVQPIRFVSIGLATSWAYRNMSLKQTTALSCGLRLPFRSVTLSLGPLVGLKTVWVGSFHTTDPIVGSRVGVIVPIAQQVAITLRQDLLWVLSDAVVNSTSTMVGFTVGMFKR